MKVLRTTLVPDESVPEFKRLRFEVADRGYFFGSGFSSLSISRARSAYSLSG